MNRSDPTPPPRGRRQLIFLEPVPTKRPGESYEAWSARAAAVVGPALRAAIRRSRESDATPQTQTTDQHDPATQ